MVETLHLSMILTNFSVVSAYTQACFTLNFFISVNFQKDLFTEFVLKIYFEISSGWKPIRRVTYHLIN